MKVTRKLFPAGTKKLGTRNHCVAYALAAVLADDPQDADEVNEWLDIIMDHVAREDAGPGRPGMTPSGAYYGSIGELLSELGVDYTEIVCYPTIPEGDRCRWMHTAYFPTVARLAREAAVAATKLLVCTDAHLGALIGDPKRPGTRDGYMLSARHRAIRCYVIEGRAHGGFTRDEGFPYRIRVEGAARPAS